MGEQQTQGVTTGNKQPNANIGQGGPKYEKEVEEAEAERERLAEARLTPNPDEPERDERPSIETRGDSYFLMPPVAEPVAGPFKSRHEAIDALNEWASKNKATKSSNGRRKATAKEDERG